VVLPASCWGTQSWGLGTIGDAASGGWIIVVGRSTGYLSTLIHEFGHNLGLDHANTLDHGCSTGKVYVQNLDCELSEYWDLYSPMALDVTGESADAFAVPFIDAAHRAYLGGFAAGQLKTQSAGTSTYSLTAAEENSGTTAVKVVSPADGSTYFVEYRAGRAGDSSAVYTWVTRDPDTGEWATGCAEPGPRCTRGVSYGSGVRVSRLVTEDSDSGWAGSSIAYPVATDTSYRAFRQHALGTGERWVSEDRTIQVDVRTVAGSTATVEVTRRAAAFQKGKPTIAGKATLGTTLVAKNGTWLPAPGSFAYQWYRGSKPIAGATGSKYTIRTEDIGARIKLRVTAKRTGFPATSNFSEPTAVIAKARQVAATPKVKGAPKIGEVLTADTSGWTPALTSKTARYQWLRDGKAIHGATKKTYTVSAADRGRRLAVKVTSTLSSAAWTPAKLTKVSPQTVQVAQASITTAKPVVKGKALKWKTLTVSPGRWSPSGIELSYQWKRGGKPIPGATSRRYKLTSADVGRKISVTVTGTKHGYGAASRTTNVGKVAP